MSSLCAIRARLVTVLFAASAATLALSGSSLAQSNCSSLPAPDPSVAEIMVPGDSWSQDSAICIDGCGRFTAVWIAAPLASTNGIFYSDHNRVVVQYYAPNGAMRGGPYPLTFDHTTTDEGDAHQHPSIATDLSGNSIRVGWDGTPGDSSSNRDLGEVPLVSDFAFGGVPSVVEAWQTLAPVHLGYGASGESVGIAGGPVISWVDSGSVTPGGLLHGLINAPAQLRACAAACWPANWQPCLASRQDGYYLLVWGEAENPHLQNPAFNIAMRLCLETTNGPITVDELATNGRWVNQPEREPPGTTQLSPAAALDDAGNIVCVWVGPAGLDADSNQCEPGQSRIYGRRFHWDGPGHLIVPQGDEFYVDSFRPRDAGGAPVELTPAVAHPTVALTNNPIWYWQGRFICAWNAPPFENPNDREFEIHAQYFSSGGQSMYKEFRVNQATDPTTSPYADAVLRLRYLSNSAQHALAYGPYDQIVLTYSTDDLFAGLDNRVFIDTLPPGYAETLCGQVVCCKGDVNGDGRVDGADIQPFVTALLTQRFDGNGGSSADCPTFTVVVDPSVMCPYDIDNDCLLTEIDVLPFVLLLLQGTGVCGTSSESESSEQTAANEGDSNSNDSCDANSSQSIDPALQAMLAAYNQCVHDHPRRNYADLTEREYTMVLLEAMCDQGFDLCCRGLRYMERHGE